MAQQRKVSVRTESHGEDIYHNVEGLPKLHELNAQVKEIVAQSTYWEKYGMGLIELGTAFPLHLLGLFMCSTESPVPFIAGFLLLGCCHSTIANRISHLAAHNAVFESKTANRFIRWLAVEFNGFFSEHAVMQIHIAEHHPYTNIIGLGDSSTWKSPTLPKFVYMFLAPFLLPIMAPIVSLKELRGKYWHIFSFCFSTSLGLAFNVFLIMKITGYTSVLNAIIFLFGYRAVTMLTYIHINIFQHIGLPMYVLKSRPAKLYQMSTGVLNLDRNIILDWIMGHTLVYCHIEHHLFPSLSDNMVLKIRPIVKQFMLDNGLPYHERPYIERLQYFVDKYEDLMVKAPPFTHYVGLQ